MRKKLVFFVALIALIVVFAMSAGLNNSQKEKENQSEANVNVTVVSEPAVTAAPVSVEALHAPEEVVKVNITEIRGYPPQFWVTLTSFTDKDLNMTINASGDTIDLNLSSKKKLTISMPINTNMQSGSISLRIKVWANGQLVFDELKDLHYGSSSGRSNVAITAVAGTVKPSPTVTYTPKPTPITPGDYC